MIPAVLVAGAGVAYVYTEEQEAYQRSLQETARALALVVDREISRREELLRSLAASPYLDRPDLPAFHAQARRLAPRWDSTIVLADAQGQQLLNTRRPFPPDAPLPRNVTFPEVRARFGPEAVVVSDLYLAPIGKQFSFAVEVPVMRDGAIKYYVAMGTFASQMQTIFAELRVPESWTVALLDGSGRIVARNLVPEKHVGERARDDLIAHSRAQAEGVFETKTRDGTAVTAVFAKTPRWDWTLAIGVPKREILSSANAAAAMMGAGALLLLGLAVALAAAFGRRIAAPVHGLAADAERVGRGERVPARRTGLPEIDRVSGALAQASAAIADAKDELERRVKAAQQETERSQRELFQAQKLDALGRLTGGIAHDFNNLLQTIRTGLHLAGMKASDDDARFAIESCRRAVEQATRLTRQLSAFAQGKSSQRTVLDLRNHLLAMTDLLKGALRSDIELGFALADDLGLVEIDPLQLELALINLAINARDAMAGGGRVEISAQNCRVREGEIAGMAAGEALCLVFADSGAGMSGEVLERAIEPFFTTKGVGKGSGLGLPQVYGFARQAGGGLVLESEPGRGTRVKIFLPRAPAQPAAAPPREAAAAACSPQTILVVEDEAMVRDIAVPALRGQGFNVIVARSAEEALALLDAGQRVDGIFSDIVMPGRYSGIDLADLVRQRHGEIPILLATGYSEQAASVRRYPVVQKPYDVAAVAAQLRELAGKPH